ncbi:MAG: nucleotidyl transferase AbiEii/AbiGii toxin family protein [Actinomycetia bacterium]|nr:nucleotidyl transferase AbiEii/AbiGii toxin family protein [Actinomycetes bacterium]
MFDPGYIAQVRLLLRCLPETARHQCFALKGGSAINLFFQDMPRISVDIDLTYLPLKPRTEALLEIRETLLSIKDNIELRISGSSVKEIPNRDSANKLIVSADDVIIKIEPNLILRGSVYPPEQRDLCKAAQDSFEVFTSVSTLSIADVYAGKLCAALDRQHPRDLFDVKLLLDDTGITPEIRRAFVVYLASGNRPINELLNPGFHDITEQYQNHFAGMSRIEISLDELQQVQRNLAPNLVASLDNAEKEFLISLKNGEPDWNLLGIDHLAQLPALQWKLINIRRMDKVNHAASLEKLKRILE